MSRHGPATLRVLADDALATLNRLISVLRARRVNVLAVSPGRTRADNVLGLSLVIDTSEMPVGRVVAMLEKIEAVRAVTQIDGPQAVCRELMLIAVRRAALTSPAVTELLEAGVARVLEEGAAGAAIQIVGRPDELDEAIAGVPAADILDLMRVGPAVVSLE